MLTHSLVRTRWGFTLIELAVTMAVLAVLVVVTVPSLASWMGNSRVRTTADSIQDGLRQAQAEAVKQNRVVAFFLSTTSPTPTGTLPGPAAPGATVNYWYAATVPWTSAPLSSTGGGGTVVNNSNLATLVASGVVPNPSAVSISESSGAISTVCFSPYGRLTATSNDPTFSVTCNVPVNSPPMVYFVVAPAGAYTGAHPLNVTVTMAGQVRVCDPQVSLSLNAPNGC